MGLEAEAMLSVVLYINHEIITFQTTNNIKDKQNLN